MLFDGMNGANAGMIEGGSGAGFAEEAFERLRIAVRVLWEKFQGDAAAELGVFGFVDDAHAAASKFAEDFVVGDGFVEHGREAKRNGRRSGDCGQFVLCYTMLVHFPFAKPGRRFQPHVLRRQSTLFPSYLRGPLVHSNAADGLWDWRSCPVARHHQQAEWLRLLHGASSKGLEYAGDWRRNRGERQTGLRQGLWVSRLREEAALHAGDAVPDRLELKTVYRGFRGHAGRGRKADMG